MRVYIFIAYILLSLTLFSQTYGYDKNYQAKLDESSEELTDEQKIEIRNNISKWAKFFLSKGYEYNKKVLVENPFSKESKNFHFDCSGYIAAVYWTSNIAVFEKQAVMDESGVRTIYATLSKYKKIYTNSLPNVGDIIMFDRTTSPHKTLTHAGIVLDVDKNDETVTYAHASTSKGLVLGYINLKYPTVFKKDNKIINSYLKRGGGVDALAAQCFNSYGTILDIP